MLLRGALFFIVLGIILFFLAKSIDIGRFIMVIRDFSILHLVLLLGMAILINIIKALRFHILLIRSSIKLRLRETILLYLGTQSLTLLPGGEAGRGLLVHKKADVPLVETSGPVISQAFLEFITATFVVIIGSFIYHVFIIPTLFATILIICLLYALMNHSLFTSLSRRLATLKPISKQSRKIPEVSMDIRNSIFKKNRSVVHHEFIYAIIIGLLANAIGGYLLYNLSSSYHLPLDIYHGIFFYSASIVLQIIGNIIPGGLGVTEGGLTGLFLLSGIGLYQALAIVVIYRFATLVVPFLIGVGITGFFYKDIVLQLVKGKKHE